jgi:hypothetical protein
MFFNGEIKNESTENAEIGEFKQFAALISGKIELLIGKKCIFIGRGKENVLLFRSISRSFYLADSIQDRRHLAGSENQKIGSRDESERAGRKHHIHSDKGYAALIFKKNTRRGYGSTVCS